MEVCIWVVREGDRGSLFNLVGLWWVSGGDCGKSVVGFFRGVGYFGVGFFGNVVQVVGFVWRGSNGLWCGDCCLMWWKSAWSCEH